MRNDGNRILLQKGIVTSLSHVIFTFFLITSPHNTHHDVSLSLFHSYLCYYLSVRHLTIFSVTKKVKNDSDANNYGNACHNIHFLPNLCLRDSRSMWQCQGIFFLFFFGDSCCEARVLSLFNPQNTSCYNNK